MMKNLDLCVVNIKHISIYDFAKNKVEAKKVLDKAVKSQEEKIQSWTDNIKKFGSCEKFENYLQKAKDEEYEIMEFDEYRELERKSILEKPIKEITEKQYLEMLNILPPKNWTRSNNYETFFSSEAFKGTFTSQYLYDKVNNKYYTKLVDLVDKSTWINNLM